MKQDVTIDMLNKPTDQLTEKENKLEERTETTVVEKETKSISNTDESSNTTIIIPPENICKAVSNLESTGASGLAVVLESNTNLQIMYRHNHNMNLMKALHIEFSTIEHAKDAVWRYVKETNIQLKIRTSKPNRSCHFCCTMHKNCPFDIRVVKERGQDVWKLKGENLNHTKIFKKTKDKRKRKQHKFHLDNTLEDAATQMSDAPKAKDIQKTATNVFMEEVTYHQAHCTVKKNTISAKARRIRLSTHHTLSY